MIIHYLPNPLETVIYLDDHDIERLRLKIIIEDLEDRIYGASFCLEEGDRFNPAEAQKTLNIHSLEDAVFNKRTDEMLQYHIDALQDIHVGDCTCVPCSCLKCRAEDLLGINTIAGLGKHPASKISGAFMNGRTIDEAIEYLENYNPVRTSSWDHLPLEDFERHIPRWRAEAAHAVKWLREYKPKIIG